MASAAARPMPDEAPVTTTIPSALACMLRLPATIEYDMIAYFVARRQARRALREPWRRRFRGAPRPRAAVDIFRR
jgi:hypothetical protein